MIFLLCGTGAAAAFVLRGISPRAAMLAGCLCLLAGMAVTFGAIATTTFGLHPTALAHSASLAVLAAAAVCIFVLPPWRQARRS